MVGDPNGSFGLMPSIEELDRRRQQADARTVRGAIWSRHGAAASRIVMLPEAEADLETAAEREEAGGSGRGMALLDTTERLLAEVAASPARWPTWTAPRDYQWRLLTPHPYIATFRREPPGIEVLAISAPRLSLGEASEHERFDQLLIAVEEGSLAEVRKLAAAGPPPPFHDRAYGRSLVTAAVTCTASTLQIMRVLLEAGADPESADARGCTPFEHAIQAGRIAMARILRPREADALAGADDALARGVSFVTIAKDETYGVLYYPTRRWPKVPAAWFDVGQYRPRGEEGGASGDAAEMLAHQLPLFAAAGATWFVPILRRLASGERVPLVEIEAACHTATGRKLRMERYDEG